MNKTLLAIFSFISLGSFAQTVNNFYTTSVPQAGYRLGAGTVNETPSGECVLGFFVAYSKREQHYKCGVAIIFRCGFVPGYAVGSLV